MQASACIPKSNPSCHSGRSEESLTIKIEPTTDKTEMFRFAQHDSTTY
jgi:hypothetical protein